MSDSQIPPQPDDDTTSQESTVDDSTADDSTAGGPTAETAPPQADQDSTAGDPAADTGSPQEEDTHGAAGPPPSAIPRPLLRRDTDKHLAGVAGGIADYVGVDAAVVRVAFAVLTIFGGIGIPLYLVCWAALPSPSMPRSYVDRWFADTPNPATVIAVGVGFVIVLAAISDGAGGSSAGLGLLLLFAGWLLFRSDNRGGAAPAGPYATPPPAATATDAGTWHGPGGSYAAPQPPVQPWVAPPPRPRSILGRLTVGTALASVGVAAALHQLGTVTLEPAQFVALAMTVIGFGLIVGAWVGRAYGLIAVGFLLLPVLLVLSLGPLPLRSGIGQASYSPTTADAVAAEYRLGIGELDVDLSAVNFGGAPGEVDVSVGLGQTTIIVPDDTTVSVEAEMSAGVIELFGERRVGRPFLGPVTDVDEGSADGGRLQIRIDNGAGEVTVRRQGEDS